MNIKRILTSIIGLPLVILIIVFGTPQVINFVLMLVALICMDEYFRAVQKISRPIKWVGYLSTVIIFLISIIKLDLTMKILFFSVPVLLLILFLHIIITNMKITFRDVAYTFLGIMYVTGLIIFLGLITISENGKIFLGYTLLIAWTTDIFAYVIGRRYGKHHFSKVSPKKSVEGCVAGTVAALIFGLSYVMILSHFEMININEKQYLYVEGITLILTIISQIGDFAASSIKRFTETKDYGSMLPGHGGMLDRIDSLIFIAPFVYMIINII